MGTRVANIFAISIELTFFKNQQPHLDNSPLWVWVKHHTFALNKR